MKPGADGNEYNDSYRLFTGSYTAPASTDKVQEIGNIVVYGEAQGSTNSKTGAYIKVNKRIAVEDGTPVRVVATQAETFPSSTLNDLSEPDYFPLPQGALDYTVGSELVYKNEDKTYTYYKLASGCPGLPGRHHRRFQRCGAGRQRGHRSPGRQQQPVHRCGHFDTAQQVSYSAQVHRLGLTIDFNYTNSVPAEPDAGQESHVRAR